MACGVDREANDVARGKKQTKKEDLTAQKKNYLLEKVVIPKDMPIIIIQIDTIVGQIGSVTCIGPTKQDGLASCFKDIVNKQTSNSIILQEVEVCRPKGLNDECQTHIEVQHATYNIRDPNNVLTPIQGKERMNVGANKEEQEVNISIRQKIYGVRCINLSKIWMLER